MRELERRPSANLVCSGVTHVTRKWCNPCGRTHTGPVAPNGLQPLAIGFANRSSVCGPGRSSVDDVKLSWLWITPQSSTGFARRVPRGRELARQRRASEWRC